METLKKISVIMLTYNREDLLERMIQCILSQTMTNFEFIIVDNGSEDKSGEIADKYAANDSRIIVVHKEKGNIGSGRNAGLDMATGEYIAFVDDDDFCESDYLEFLYELAINTNADISICGATDKAFDERYVMSAEEAMETLLWRKRFNVQFPTKMIKRHLFNSCRFLDTGKYDDIYLMPRIIAKAKLVAYHGISKYHFNRHNNNVSAWTQNHKLLDKTILQEYLQVYRDRTEWLCDIFPNNARKWKYFEWSFMISMVEKISRLKLEDCFLMCNEMKKILKMKKDEFLACSEILDFEKEWLEGSLINYE